MIIWITWLALFKAKQADIGSIQVETKGNPARTQEKDRSKGRAMYFGFMSWSLNRFLLDATMPMPH
jgi:hypothetical protein